MAETDAEKKTASDKKTADKGVQAAPLSQPADPRERKDMGPVDNAVGAEATSTTTPNEVARSAGLQSENSEKHLALVDAPGPDGKAAKVEADDDGLAKSTVYERYLQKGTDATPIYRLIVKEGAPLTEATAEAVKRATA